MACVVVGVDGSDASVDALRFAADEARLRQIPLRVVCAWSTPVAADWPTGVTMDPVHFEESAHRIVSGALTAIGSELTGVDVQTAVVVGGAAPVLLEQCSEDDVLVVGSRGRGGFTGLLLGSVSQHVVAHAPCPVIVVHHRRDTAMP